MINSGFRLFVLYFSFLSQASDGWVYFLWVRLKVARWKLKKFESRNNPYCIGLTCIVCQRLRIWCRKKCTFSLTNFECLIHFPRPMRCYRDPILIWLRRGRIMEPDFYHHVNESIKTSDIRQYDLARNSQRLPTSNVCSPLASLAVFLLTCRVDLIALLKCFMLYK